MKKTIIIVGAILIILALAVWGYLLFFGTPDSADEVFANLGFSGSSTPIVATPTDTASGGLPVQQTKRKPLRQLTTKPVAGFAFFGTSSEAVRYVERGTGHMFEINVNTGEESRLSGTTVPKVVEAVFSPSSTAVALVAEDGYRRSVLTGLIRDSEEQVDYLSLPPNAFAPHFETNTRVQYALVSGDGTTGFSVDVRDNEPVRDFTIPLQDVHPIYSDEIFVYNRPSPNFQGSLYTVNPTLQPRTPAENGLVAGVTDTHILYTHSDSESQQLVSFAVDRATTESLPLAITFIPEKCSSVPNNADLLWCGNPIDALTSTQVDNWYKGVVQFEDLLWRVDVNRGEAQLFADPLRDVGRLIDIDKIISDNGGTASLFRNKTDNTLWIYDSSLE